MCAGQPRTRLGPGNGGRRVGLIVHSAAKGQPQFTLFRNSSPLFPMAKNSRTADPTANGYVYAVWDQLSVFPQTKDAAQLLAENDGVLIARKLLKAAASAAGGAPLFKFNFTGPSFFSRSIDNGVTWSTASPIYRPGTNAQTIDNIVRVLPDGTLLDFFTAINVTTSGLSIGYI